MKKKQSLSQLNPNFVAAKKNRKKLAITLSYYLIGAVISFFFILPIFYMLAVSTKSKETFAQTNYGIMMFLPDFSNIGHFFNNYGIAFGKLWKYALNSFGYAAICIVLNVLVNGLAGYVLAKFHFPGKGFFNFIILFLIIVPVETSIIPLYSIVKKLLHLGGGIKSILAVILPSIISVFNIFLFTQFFSSIPKEYEEAMHIDGASKVRIFFDLIVPMSKPIIATVAVFTFIGVWNDYVWPDMVLDKAVEGWPVTTIQISLYSLQNNNDVEIGAKMAALVLTTIPIFVVYAAAQKYIVKGFGTAGLKM